METSAVFARQFNCNCSVFQIQPSWAEIASSFGFLITITLLLVVLLAALKPATKHNHSVLYLKCKRLGLRMMGTNDSASELLQVNV